MIGSTWAAGLVASMTCTTPNMSYYLIFKMRKKYLKNIVVLYFPSFCLYSSPPAPLSPVKFLLLVFCYTLN